MSRIATGWLLLLVILSGCASKIAITQANNPGDSEPMNLAEEQHVAFVTTRAQTTRRDQRYYTGLRGELTAGYCQFEQVAGKPRLTKVIQAEPAQLLPSDGQLVIYVHGYNEGFERSCRRAAILSKSLSPLPLLLFSWPANTNPLTYADDIRDMQWNTTLLNGFIKQLLNTDTEIVLIGHSMGARGIAETLLAREPFIGHLPRVIMIAPDIDSDDFTGFVEPLLERVSALTVYVSEDDYILRVSNFVNGGRRLGQGRPTLVTPGLKVIDVSETESRRLGHKYHLNNPVVIEDLRVELGIQNTSELSERNTVADGFLQLQPHEASANAN